MSQLAQRADPVPLREPQSADVQHLHERTGRLYPITFYDVTIGNNGQKGRPPSPTYDPSPCPSQRGDRYDQTTGLGVPYAPRSDEGRLGHLAPEGPLARRDMIGVAVKDKIHPKWFPDARVHCACGNTFTTGSTLKEIAVEICSACHPLFTGQQKFVDTAGRVDKFNQRVAAAERKKAEADERKRKKAEEAAAAL